MYDITRWMLRMMTWERAKGELRSIECANDAPMMTGDFASQANQQRHALIEDFIAAMEAGPMRS